MAPIRGGCRANSCCSSDPAGRPLELNFALLEALFTPKWASALPALARLGISGVVRPGVDGDLIGVLSSTRAFEEVVLESLRQPLNRSTWIAMLSQRASLRSAWVAYMRPRFRTRGPAQNGGTLITNRPVLAVRADDQTARGRIIAHLKLQGHTTLLQSC